MLPAAACLLALVVSADAPIMQVWPTGVFVMQTDGTGVRLVTRVDGYFDLGSPRFSHDGRRLAFDAARGAPHGPRACFVVSVDGTGLAELGKGQAPDWSPDDKQIVLATDTGEIVVQNLDGKGRTQIARGGCPRFSPDGSRLAVSDRHGLRVVDLLSGAEIQVFNQPLDDVFDGFTWSPDGKRLAVVARVEEGGRRQLLVADVDANGNLPQPRLKNAMGGYVSFSPDGRQIVFADAWKVKIADVSAVAGPRDVPGQEGLNRHPVYSPDGKSIAFVSTRTPPQPAPATAQLARTWKLEEVKRHRKGTIVYALGFTPDGSRLVLGCDPQSKGVQVWNISTGETRDLGGNGIRVEMFPDGRRFATSWHSPLIQIIDIETGELLREMDHGARMWVLAVSPDGRRMVSGGLDKTMRVWDPDTGEQLQAFGQLHDDWITRVRFTSDGREALTVSHDHTLAAWDLETGRVRLRIKHPAAVWGLAVTPDGRHLLTGTGGSLQSSLTVLNIGQGTDNVLRMWDAASGNLVREMKGHDHAVYAIDVSPDGRLAATGDWGGTLRLWNLETGAELSKVGPGQGRVPFVAFSPDGKTIAAGGGGRRVGREIVQFPDEQVRLYRVVETTPAAAPKQP
jgi:WD40 repeat protein